MRECPRFFTFYTISTRQSVMRRSMPRLYCLVRLIRILWNFCMEHRLIDDSFLKALAVQEENLYLCADYGVAVPVPVAVSKRESGAIPELYP